VTNGEVYALEPTMDGRVLLGGTFTRLGPRSGSWAAIGARSGAWHPSWPEVSGKVTALVPDGSGGWTIGGSLGYVEGVRVRRLAHIRPDRGLDMSWMPNPDDDVLALVRRGDVLFVGGEFDSIGGARRHRLAAQKVRSGRATTWDPDVDGDDVEELALGTGCSTRAAASERSDGADGRGWPRLSSRPAGRRTGTHAPMVR
jgi:hypothetical protein